MKVTRQLERIEPMILGPLAEAVGDDWHYAPDGKWSLAQILSHLAIGIDIVASVFDRRAGRTDMKRRATPKQQLLRQLALGVGKLPSPQKVPKSAYPEEHPDPELISAQFRIGVERFAAMVEQWPQERQENIFVGHPVFGDLNLPEWIRFFYLHCRYYEHKINVRLRLLRRSARQ